MNEDTINNIVEKGKNDKYITILEKLIISQAELPHNRPNSIFKTKLEEAYMWREKGIIEEIVESQRKNNPET